MSEQEQINAGLCDAIIKLLVRGNLVEEDDVLAIADEYDLLAERSDADHERTTAEGVAHQLRCVLLELDPPPEKDPTSDLNAKFRRDQIRKRTAMIERQAKERGE